MKKRKNVIKRVDLDFAEMINDIKLEKIKNKTADRFLSDERITKMFTRVPNVKDFIIKSPLVEDVDKLK